VRVIAHEKNLGLAAARNTGVTAARNDFVASIDADCCPEKDWLARAMRHFREPSCAGVGGRLIELHQKKIADAWRAAHMAQDWGIHKCVNPPFLFGSNTVFRKQALFGAGLYDEAFRTNGEDRDISIRLAMRGHALVYDPEAVVVHRRTDTVGSVLRAHWNWTFLGVTTSRPPTSLYAIACRTWDNLYFFAPAACQDSLRGRVDLALLDGLCWLHHIFFDCRHYLREQ
jgi:cellulose synthase/poly-beta-1,6-N-acetylglucosamine synthase-like glycosyltransferase